MLNTSSASVSFEYQDSGVSLQDRFLNAIQCVDDVILGKREQVDMMFVALLAGGHVLLDDTPGTGKTTLARSMSSVLGMDWRRVQFTSDLMPSDIIGLASLNGNAPGTPLQFQPGPVFTNLFLADEINRASPRTQSALLEAMAERQATVDGVTHQLPNPFWVVATQNPVDFSGTHPLPDSQMDRFLFRMALGYPDQDNEMKLLMGEGGTFAQKNLHALLRTEDILQAQQLIGSQKASNTLVEYLHRLILATRHHQDIITGLSPRAGLSLLHAARAHAWLRKRDHVLPEDVKAVFVHGAAHRLKTHHHDFEERRKIAQKILAATSCP